MSNKILEKDMTAILKDPDKLMYETKGVGGILAKLWRVVLFDLKVSDTRFEHLCMNYVANARKNLQDSRVANFFNRGNLRRELAKPTMTWKVLIKGLKVLEFGSMELSVKLTHRSGKVSIHSVIVDVANADIAYEPDDQQPE